MLPPHTALRGGCARRILISSPVPWICLQNKPEVVAISMVVAWWTHCYCPSVMDAEILLLMARVFLLWKRQNVSSECVCSMRVLGGLMKTGAAPDFHPFVPSSPCLRLCTQSL